MPIASGHMIRNILVLSSVVLPLFAFSQSGMNEYLKANRQDLRQSFDLPTEGKKIIGFGALHGSAKTEEAELILLKNIMTKGQLKFYFPETDFSTAFFFEKYLQGGSEKLLDELVKAYTVRVPQEGSIEMLEKWKKLRDLYQVNKLTVIGIDQIASYEFPLRHLAELMKPSSMAYMDSLTALLADPKTDYTAYYTTGTKNLLKRFVLHFERNRELYFRTVADTWSFSHVVHNLKSTFNRGGREEQMYQNYRALQERYVLKDGLQFFRLGIFHLMKDRVNGNPSFFTKLIEHGDYERSAICTIQGFLTRSRVLWENKYDKSGKYAGYRSKGGYSISDNFWEHYKGIKFLKRNKLSDLTWFALGNKNSPFTVGGGFHLVSVKSRLGRSPWKPTAGQSSANYIDAAILISGSEACRPVESRVGAR
jgi:hypothetical protein